MKKRKICNLEAYDKYIKKFKCDWEAAGLSLSDQSLLCEKDEVRAAVKCSFCNGQHNVCSCPQRHAAMSGCLSLEDHLIACVFRNCCIHDADGSTCNSSSLN